MARKQPTSTMSEPTGITFVFLNRMLILVVLVGLVAGGALFLRPEMRLQQEADVEIALLEAERDAARKLRDEHQRKLDWVRNDPEYLEVVARDVLDLYSPGEVVLRLER